MNERIIYVAGVEIPGTQGQNRCVSPAGAAKAEYIAGVLGRCGRRVSLVCPAWTQNTRGGFRGRRADLPYGGEARCFATIGCPGRVGRLAGAAFTYALFSLYLLTHVRRGDTLLVYHSPLYARLIRFLRKTRRIRLILEVEEVYADISGSARQRAREQAVRDAADAFIFASALLGKQLNTANKPFAVVYGAYNARQPVPDADFGDGRIHAVYAGTLDPRKGGAQAAVASAQYLDNNYHIHIIGHGTPDEVANLKKLIDAAPAGGAALSWDGLKRGEDYTLFLGKCRVGLSTQLSQGKYNETSFPSKVLSYMQNSLSVVTARLAVLEECDFGAGLFFYEGDDPAGIAAAIRRAGAAKTDSAAVLEGLDAEFIKSLDGLLERVDGQ